MLLPKDTGRAALSEAPPLQRVSEFRQKVMEGETQRWFRSGHLQAAWDWPMMVPSPTSQLGAL